MSAPVAVPFRLARRLDDVGFSDIVQIRNRVMELRAKGAAVYQFEGGEPYRTTPDYIKSAVVTAARRK
jgi:aspartate aminotransferase